MKLAGLTRGPDWIVSFDPGARNLAIAIQKGLGEESGSASKLTYLDSYKAEDLMGAVSWATAQLSSFLKSVFNKGGVLVACEAAYPGPARSAVWNEVSMVRGALLSVCLLAANGEFSNGVPIDVRWAQVPAATWRGALGIKPQDAKLGVGSIDIRVRRALARAYGIEEERLKKKGGHAVDALGVGWYSAIQCGAQQFTWPAEGTN